MYYGDMMGMHTLWWFFWLVVIVGWLFWWRGAAPDNGEQLRETPHEVLRRRLANSEISTEEYEKRKAVLDRDT